MKHTAPAAFPLTWMEIRNEPFRLLFPLGFMLAIMGIGAWIPFYLWPAEFPYPGQGHAIVQIQGFLMCFILGFLLTMLPKVLGVATLGRLQSILIPAGIIALSVCAWMNTAGYQMAVQALNLFLIGNFLVFALLRWPNRKTPPPSTFIFIPLAFAANAIGTALRIVFYLGALDADALRLASLLQYQAFPLLLILGIGGFLLPRFFGTGVIDPAAPRGPKGVPLLLPLAMAALLIAGYALEAAAPWIGSGTLPVRLAYLLRTAVWAWFIFGQLRLTRITGKPPPYLSAARIALFLIGLGTAMPILLPAYLLAWEHVIFINGFLWLTFSVAARVAASHGGRMDVLDQHRKKLLGFGILLFIAMATRVATDIWTDGHWMHLALASAFALIALGIWGRIFLPVMLLVPGKNR